MKIVHHRKGALAVIRLGGLGGQKTFQNVGHHLCTFPNSILNCFLISFLSRISNLCCPISCPISCPTSSTRKLSRISNLEPGKFQISVKGQLILKANFLVFICTKKWTKFIFDFCLKGQIKSKWIYEIIHTPK